MILNNCQEKIARIGVDWYRNSPEQIFQISGEAGTGKSVLIHEIINRCMFKPGEVMAMAYTGQASMVMRTKGFLSAKTCHSSLFKAIEVPMTDALGNTIYDSTFNRPIMKTEFVPITPTDIADVKLFVIDEGGMVPMWMKPIIEKYNKKILVAGDIGQLPPVGDNPAYLVDGKIYFLTEIMRQKKDSAILYIAKRCRNGLPIHCGYYNSGYDSVLVIPENEMTLEMMMYANVIICGKNKTRDRFNNQIRKEIIGTDSKTPIYGERIICRKNAWDICVGDIALANGLSGTVVNPPSVETYQNNQFKIDFLPDLSDFAFKDLMCDYEYFTATHEERQLRHLKENPYNNGAKFEFAYGLTTHLTQGAEYNQGIYFQEFLNRDIQTRLDYTAVTRFKKNIIFVVPNKRFW